MVKLGKINDRNVEYIKVNDLSVLKGKLPKDNWILLAVADIEQTNKIHELSVICFDHYVRYVCGTGSGGTKIDDYFDEEYLIRLFRAGKEPIDENLDDMPMTVWSENFEEEFWFATCLANEENIELNKVVCINLTDVDYENEILYYTNNTPIDFPLRANHGNRVSSCF